jgi:ankyrin repeat protein
MKKILVLILILGFSTNVFGTRKKDVFDEIVLAIESGNVEKIKNVASKNVNLTNRKGQTPIIISVSKDLLSGKNSSFSITNELILKGADVTKKDKRGWSVFSIAATNCRFDIFENIYNKYLEKNTSEEDTKKLNDFFINTFSWGKQTVLNSNPFYQACSRCSSEEAEFFVEFYKNNPKILSDIIIKLNAEKVRQRQYHKELDKTYLDDLCKQYNNSEYIVK